MRKINFIIILATLLTIFIAGAGYDLDSFTWAMAKGMKRDPYFISSVAISPQGKLAACGRSDDRIIVWDIENKKVAKIIANPSPHNWGLTFSNDSKELVYQNQENEVVFLVLDSGEVEKKTHFDEPLDSIALSPDSKKIILGGLAGGIQVINLLDNTRAVLKVEDIYGGFRGIDSVVFSPCGKRMLSAGRGNLEKDVLPEPQSDFAEMPDRSWSHIVKSSGLCLWDAQNYQKIKKMSGHRERINAVFSPDSKYLLSADENGYVFLWDAQTGEKIRSYEPRHGSKGIGFLANGRYFVDLDEYNKRLNLWETHTGKLIKKIKVKKDPVSWQLVTNPQENLIVIGNEDGTISVYKFVMDKLKFKKVWLPKSSEVIEKKYKGTAYN